MAEAEHGPTKQRDRDHLRNQINSACHSVSRRDLCSASRNRHFVKCRAKAFCQCGSVVIRPEVYEKEPGLLPRECAEAEAEPPRLDSSSNHFGRSRWQSAQGRAPARSVSLSGPQRTEDGIRRGSASKSCFGLTSISIRTLSVPTSLIRSRQWKPGAFPPQLVGLL